VLRARCVESEDPGTRRDSSTVRRLGVPCSIKGQRGATPAAAAAGTAAAQQPLKELLPSLDDHDGW